MKTILFALALLAAPITANCQQQQRLSSREWSFMYRRCTAPEYDLWQQGKMTSDEYYRWCGAVREAMIKKYGLPIPPQPQPPPRDFRAEQIAREQQRELQSLRDAWTQHAMQHNLVR